MRFAFHLTVTALLAAALSSCGSEKDASEEGGKPVPATKPSTPAAPPSAATAPAKPDLAAAREFYATRCASCHGATGVGDGPAAAQLDPKPRNYTDKTWQASVTDQDIEATILKGGAAFGKSPVMPPTPDLADKPELLRDLRLVIRGFGGG